VREQPEGIVFLRTLVPGSTDRSYGIHVARLAGVPADLIKEAERLLKQLESDMPAAEGRPGRKSRRARYTQGILIPTEGPARPSEVENELQALDPDRMTPIDALQWIRQAKSRRKDAPPPS
jgi:DNA mismatch repair protein MutS